MFTLWVANKALFFLYLVCGFFSPKNQIGGGKKNKNKISKKYFLFNLKHIWIGGKKNNKNCIILHSKNAEMAIIYFFKINLAVFYIGGNKKDKNNFFFFSKLQKFGSEDP